ncbi:OmpW/AlkL family protein [Kaarinaea lacus]
MSVNKKIMFGLLVMGLLGGNSIAHAVEKGDWLLRFGVTMVAPDASSSGPAGVLPDDAVDVDDGTSVSEDGTYMFRDNIGFELLAAYPFSHDITLNGTKIAETDQLPPTFSVQYHFRPKTNVRPYAGIGLNYTTFFSESITTEGTSAGLTSLSLDDSIGLALQGGIDIDISKKWYVNLVLRYINIETTAKTNVGDINVDINPWVYTLGVGTSF